MNQHPIDPTSGSNPSVPDSVTAEPTLTTDLEPRHSEDVLPIHKQVIREMSDPRDGVAPTPVWLMLVYFGLLMWGGYYLAANAGGFRVDVYNEDPAALYAGASEAAVAKPVDLAVVGKRAYNNCVQCHQPDGQGVTGAFPPLNGSERVAGPPHVLVALLLHGLQGPALVQGEQYNGEMPGWNQLSDAEIAGVLTHIRSSWGNQFSPVSPELVAAMRTATTSRAGAYSDEALDALADAPPPLTELPPAPVSGTSSAQPAGGL